QRSDALRNRFGQGRSMTMRFCLLTVSVIQGWMRTLRIIQLMQINRCRYLIERFPWQFCYWSGLIILFALAAWERFRLPLYPIADPDTWGYLSPALRKLTGGEFGHTSGRNFIYPGFLYLGLRVFQDFRAITAAQHVFGLSAGGMLLLTWRRTRVLVARP